MSSTSLIENATSPIDWVEGAFIVIKENMHIFTSSEYSKKAAEANNSFDQFFLGYCYNNGIGTSQDRGKAFELYSKAGNTNTLNNLGICYNYGWGTTKNEEKAFELYSKAAEVGSLLGQINLRVYYPNGLETMKDPKKVGNWSPQTNIGMHYRNRWGTAKNLQEAFKFYLIATQAGN
ncbi:hypothetical protein G9A89_005117 [Geosiphon pyriformis]|nr:hypothetical protein G9A89_005117 [Geosiphon pyriformis]